jgi:hypothetical protein
MCTNNRSSDSTIELLPSLNFDGFLIFLIRIVGDGAQLVPFDTVTTNRPIVPTLGDYDDGKIGGMMIGRGK